jgi:hypothetical protein
MNGLLSQYAAQQQQSAMAPFMNAGNAYFNNAGTGLMPSMVGNIGSTPSLGYLSDLSGGSAGGIGAMPFNTIPGLTP